MRSLEEHLRRAVRFERAGAATLETRLEAFEAERAGVRVRYHLRTEPDGRGLLIVAASRLVRLSGAGVRIARGLLAGRASEDVLAEMRHAHRGVDPERIRADVAEVSAILRSAPAEAGYPVLNLDDPAVSPHDVALAAPFEASVLVAGGADVTQVLGRLWDAGIPHVLLRGRSAEPEALRRAVEHAEDLGMIAGVALRGSELRTGETLRALADAGVDHLNVPVLDEASHDALFGSGDHAAALSALEEACRLEVCPVAELPLLRARTAALPHTLARLRSSGVRDACCWALAARDEREDDHAHPARALRQVAADIEDLASSSDVRLLWLPSVERRAGVPVSEQLAEGPRCAGDVGIAVDGQGAVFASRGPAQAVGNLLTDSWPAIWSHPAFRRVRERVTRPTHCGECPGLAVCAADCPAAPEGWAS